MFAILQKQLGDIIPKDVIYGISKFLPKKITRQPIVFIRYKETRSSKHYIYTTG